MKVGSFRECSSCAIGPVLHFGGVQSAAVDAFVAVDADRVVDRGGAHHQIGFHIRRLHYGEFQWNEKVR